MLHFFSIILLANLARKRGENYMKLNEKEELVYSVIKKIVNKEITRKEGMYELNLSRQQIYRLIIIYKEEGKNGFIHKNRGKKSINKIDEQIMKDIENIYLSEYYDYDFIAYHEELKEKYKDKCDFSYSSLYRYFLSKDIISPLAHKKTVKVYNETMKEAISNNNIQENKLELFQTRKIATEQAHVRRSGNLFAFGQEVQMDACQKVWFGNIVTYLHSAVDKGTKKVLFGWFEYEEITRAYFILIFNIIIKYGIPESFKTDNRNSFSNGKNKVETTQIGLICDTLKIALKTSSSPTFKSNVERANKTFKDRLIAELRHENITDIDTANEYLNDIFIPKMNNKFSYKIDPKTSKMKPNNYSMEELNLIISEKYTRIIDNASSIKYNNKYYVPINPNTGEVVCFMRKTECELIISYNYEFWCRIENTYYKLHEIENRNLTMEKEEVNQQVKEKKKYVPPANHPWRKKFL